MCLCGYHHLFYIAVCHRLVTVHLTGNHELQHEWINSYNFITWVNVELKQKSSQETKKKKKIHVMPLANSNRCYVFLSLKENIDWVNGEGVVLYSTCSHDHTAKSRLSKFNSHFTSLESQKRTWHKRLRDHYHSLLRSIYPCNSETNSKRLQHNTQRVGEASTPPPAISSYLLPLTDVRNTGRLWWSWVAGYQVETSHPKAEPQRRLSDHKRHISVPLADSRCQLNPLSHNTATML